MCLCVYLPICLEVCVCVCLLSCILMCRRTRNQSWLRHATACVSLALLEPDCVLQATFASMRLRGVMVLRTVLMMSWYAPPQYQVLHVIEYHLNIHSIFSLYSYFLIMQSKCTLSVVEKIIWYQLKHICQFWRANNLNIFINYKKNYAMKDERCKQIYLS